MNNAPDTILVIGIPPVNLSRRALTFRFNELVTVSLDRELTPAELRELRRIHALLSRVEQGRAAFVAPLMLPPLPPSVLIAPWVLLCGVLALVFTADADGSPGLWAARVVFVLAAAWGAAHLPEDESK